MNALEGERSSVVAAHLASCDDCMRLVRRERQQDAALGGSVHETIESRIRRPQMVLPSILMLPVAALIVALALLLTILALRGG